VTRASLSRHPTPRHGSVQTATQASPGPRRSAPGGFLALPRHRGVTISRASRHGNGLVPIGCVEGCIIGSGVFEGIARYYGIARTLTPSSWQGKCFSQDASPVPANPPNSYLPGTKVTNRIKVNYGVFINRLLGLDEPLTLYEGKTRMGESWFAEGEDAVIVEYDVETHEFTGFRDGATFPDPESHARLFLRQGPEFHS
jgi:hypothetical protein